MILDKAARRLESVVKPVSRVLNIVGVGILMVMMFLTVTDVCLRVSINEPIVGAYEISSFLQVILIFFGLAYTEVVKGHIQIDVITTHLPQKVQAALDSLFYIVGIGILSLIVWQNFNVGTMKWIAKEITGIPLPVGPFHFVIVLGTALFCLVLLINLIDSLTKLAKR